MASGAQTGAHIPQPLQTELFISAMVLPSFSDFKMASNGQAAWQAPHQVHLSGSMVAINGSDSNSPLLIMEYDFVAAESAELTDSAIFFGP